MFNFDDNFDGNGHGDVTCEYSSIRVHAKNDDIPLCTPRTFQNNGTNIKDIIENVKRHIIFNIYSFIETIKYIYFQFSTIVL